MLQEKTVGFIGAGNMGEALLAGLLKAGLSEPDRLYCADASEERLAQLKARYGVRTAAGNIDLIRHVDVVVYAVKPQIMGAVISETIDALDTSKLIISIAAGVPISAISTASPHPLRVIRAMPNVCVSVQAGATALAPGEHARADDLDTARAIFDAVGRCVVVQSEQLLDAVTGLSGSGPAYVFIMLDALADGGVKMGLARPEALQLAAQTLMGAAEMHLQTGLHPGQLKDMVTSPGGTTISGLHELDRGGLRNSLINAVEAAAHRATALGESARRK